MVTTSAHSVPSGADRSGQPAWRRLVAVVLIALLSPVPALFAFWADADGDGAPDTWIDPSSGAVFTLSELDSFSWDIDGDGLANAHELALGTNPFVADTDGDGLWDEFDPLPLDSSNSSQANGIVWGAFAMDDADGDGIPNFTDADPYGAGGPAVDPDSDGDGIPDLVDPAPGDPYNISPTNGFPWMGDALADSDGDGVPNFHDWYPYDASRWDEVTDGDNDGIPDGSDPNPNDSSNYSFANGISWGADAFGDADGDGIPNFFDAWPDDRLNGQSDTDMDGIPDPSDPAPGDPMNYSSYNDRFWNGTEALGDADNDGRLNFFDRYPEDFYNGNPPVYDSDQDGIPDNIDPDPGSPYNSSPNNGISWGDNALGDDDNDGTPNYWDSDPYPLDSDGDGLTDSVDPAPFDPANFSAVNSRTWPGLSALGDLDNDGQSNFYDPEPEGGPESVFIVEKPRLVLSRTIVPLNLNFDEGKVGAGSRPVADLEDPSILSMPKAEGEIGKAVTKDLIKVELSPSCLVTPYPNPVMLVRLKVAKVGDGPGNARLHVVTQGGESVRTVELGAEYPVEVSVVGLSASSPQAEIYIEGVAEGRLKLTAEFPETVLPSPFVWEGYDPLFPSGAARLAAFSLSQEFEVPGSLLVADVDRDGIIDPIKDVSALAAARCLRHWVNDDSDAGEAGDAWYQDIPGSASAAGMENGHVDGSRDLVDFFPVLVRLPPVRLGEVSSMKLRNVDEAFNVVFTKLARGKVRDYLKVPGLSDCGLDGREAVASAVTHRVTSAGLAIPLEYFNGKPGREGILLVEASRETDSPLELVIEFADGQESRCSIPVSARGVEKMFRHAKLTGLAREYDGSPITPPKTPRGHEMEIPSGLPDSETNGKYFVFVHGYNIDGQEARGWNAEMFKRMYALGSEARFIGVTWNGTPHTYVPDLISEGYPDYHKAVFHAFLTGDGLAAALGLPAGADVTVAAHSLGNIVVNHAIQSGGFRPSRYYMINAVVPMEALDPSVLVDPDYVPDLHLDLDEQDDRSQMARQMTESDWDGRNPRLFASNWHKLFAGDAGDARRNLKWAGLFKGIGSNPNVYNFYSKGEDVVQNPKSRSSWVVADVVRNWDKKRGAWGHQEMIKGGAGLGAAVMSRVQGGWSANLAAYSFNHAPSKAQALDSLLKINPYFNKFQEVALFSPDEHVASAMAAEPKVRYDLLARGIPALSYAAAANKIKVFTDDRNFDMEAVCREPGTWPTEGHDGDRRGRWIHSDFKNVALPYVRPMFQKMITTGGLNSQ